MNKIARRLKDLSVALINFSLPALNENYPNRWVEISKKNEINTTICSSRTILPEKPWHFCGSWNSFIIPFESATFQAYRQHWWPMNHVYVTFRMLLIFLSAISSAPWVYSLAVYKILKNVFLILIHIIIESKNVLNPESPFKTSLTSS